jgi:hypothetical protein
MDKYQSNGRPNKNIRPGRMKKRDSACCNQNGHIGNDIVARTEPSRTHIEIVGAVTEKQDETQAVS